MHASLFALVLALQPMGKQVFAHPTNRERTITESGRAIYMLTNGQENAVVALRIADNGLLYGGTSIATGGEGSPLINATSNLPVATDAFASQSSVAIAGDNLFAVNAGSNTVTMFAIDQTDPTKLTIVGQPVPVSGDFPNTVAASTQNKLVCVGSSGVRAGVSCSSFSAEGGIQPMDALRQIDLNQTAPPTGPADTISQVFFSNDQTILFTTVKGDPTKNNTGFLGAYPVSGGTCGPASVGQQVTKSAFNGTALLFGSTTIPYSNNIFVTDATFGALVLSINPQTEIATIAGKGVIAGQQATCWVTISPVTHTAFVTDVLSDRLVEMSLTDASVIGSPIDLSANGDPGLVDIKAAGRFLYALAPGTGTTVPAVTVVDVLSRQQVQHFTLGDFGMSNVSEGLALLH